MKNKARSAVVAVGAAVGVALAVASTAWACIAGPTLNVNPAQVKPGEEVTLSGFSYKGDLPIVVRFNALDGPVLGTFQPVEGRFGDPEILSGKVTIPPETKPGSYILIATQSQDGALAQVPVRALITVTSTGGAPIVGAPPAPIETGRAVGLVQSEPSPSAIVLVLIGLGAAIVAAIFAWIVAVRPVQRRDVPEMVRTTR